MERAHPTVVRQRRGGGQRFPLGPSAYVIARDLARSPPLAPSFRRSVLPLDVLNLVKLAAGSPETVAEATRLTGDEESLLRASAIFFIEQILWPRDADSYRILGVSQSAPQGEIQEHFRWFMRWLHPDKNSGERAPQRAARVLKAWETIKTPERRSGYDAKLAKKTSPRRTLAHTPSAQVHRLNWREQALTARGDASKMRILLLAIGAIVAIAGMFLWPIGG